MSIRESYNPIQSQGIHNTIGDSEIYDDRHAVASGQLDLSYKLFLITNAFKASKDKSFSTISEKISQDYGKYISPNECADIINKNFFLINKSSLISILLTLVSALFFAWQSPASPILYLCILLLSPLIFNAYNEALICVQILFFNPHKFIPAISSDISSLKSTSVIIASRNEPFEVAKMTFDSAVALISNYGKKEIIVVDNSDVLFPDYILWKNYVESFQNKIPDVRVVFLHRDGVVGFKPRNLDMALNEVTADFILYLDVDSTVREDTLLRILPIFERDKKLGFVQLYTAPTNINGKSNLALAQGIRNYFLRFATVINAYSGHCLFYGHNAIWRTSLVRKMGSCLEHHRGEVVVTEDLSMSFRARAHGYHGVGACLESGEWVPESMRETEAMWLRWTVGTYQVYTKHFATLIRQKKLNVQEFLGWLHHIVTYVNCGLVPVYVSLGLILNSTLLMGLAALSFLPEVVSALCAGLKMSLGKMNTFKKIRKCYSAFLILSTFINWIRFIGLYRYLTGQKQSWTPTGKATEAEISFYTLIRDRHGYILFALSCTLYSLYSLFYEHHNIVNNILVSFCGLYGINSLLSIYLFGKSRMQESVELATSQGGINNFSGFFIKDH